jgi:thioredoxin reductase (NADPH)
VVGGGNSGFDESLYLLSLGVARIVMVEALDSCGASEITQASFAPILKWTLEPLHLWRR